MRAHLVGGPHDGHVVYVGDNGPAGSAFPLKVLVPDQWREPMARPWSISDLFGLRRKADGDPTSDYQVAIYERRSAAIDWYDATAMYRYVRTE